MNLKMVFILALAFGIFVVASFPSKSDIIAAWLFDEGSGKVLKDTSGSGNDGEIFGSAKWVEGKFGKALFFDGGKTGVDYISVPDSDILDIEEEITIAYWAKAESFGGLRMPIKKEAVYALDISESNIALYIANPSEAWKGPATGKTGLSANEWYHLAGTFDGETMRVFVNAKEDGKAEYKGTIAVTDRVLMMGVNVLNNEAFRNVPSYHGTLDDMAIFNIALDANEIQALMSKGLSDYLSVHPRGKLPVIWSELKSN